MSDRSEQPDPAAIFAAAISLWRECHDRCRPEEKQNLSEIFNGTDEFMRVVMDISTRFEDWACRHVDFDELTARWPYILEDRFGNLCVSLIGAPNLIQFDERSCLRIALRLGVPLKSVEELPVPVDASAINPVPNSPFRAFRIQTVRQVTGTNSNEPFTADDDPFDERFEPPEFALYGIDVDGLLEHIADRPSFADALDLVGKIAPGVRFTVKPPPRCRD
jgi:hypothetical protein